MKSGGNAHDIYMEPNLFWGLVAHYTFDGDARDSSGNGNHGTVHGATLVEDRFGMAGKAYRFDGRDDYIEVERHSFIKPQRQEISVAAWLKLSENTGTTKVVYAHDFHITQSVERIGFVISTPSTNTAYKDISYNEWLHFVGIYDGNEIRVYINGAENPARVAHPGSIFDPEPGINLNFGRSFMSTGEDYWVGIIDDFRIYDRILTDEEINELASDKP